MKKNKKQDQVTETEPQPLELNIEGQTIVVGAGWAALGTVGFLASEGREVLWIHSTGARLVAPLGSLEHGPGVTLWQELAWRWGLDAGEAQVGTSLREFRNKSFRQPSWIKAPTPELRTEVRDELLWEPERRLAAVFESSFAQPLSELEERLRAEIVASGVRVLEGVPVSGFRIEAGRVQAVVLGSGVEVPCADVVFADRWSVLPELTGLPRPLGFLRGREAMSTLQATFTHHEPVGAGVRESFYGSLNKDAGEDIERHVWGHFSEDGLKSFWTVCLSPEEGEDNHIIGKKLRRMKAALDKMFTGESWLPAGKPENAAFMDNVAAEQVRFEENVIWAQAEKVAEPMRLPKLEGIAFLTDGYGPSSALAQVGAWLGIDAKLDVEGEVNEAAPEATEAAEAGAEAGASESEAAEEPVAEPISN